MFITQLQQLSGRAPRQTHLDEPISDEVDLKGRAWSALDVVALGVFTLEQAAAFYQVDPSIIAQYESKWRALR